MPKPNILGGLLTNLGYTLAAPAAVGLGDYLRSPQGVLLKDRLRQGDISGAFTALTGIGRSNAPRLTQYNPPGFDPSKPTSLQDVVQSANKVFQPDASTFGAVSSQLERAYQDEKRRATQLSEQDPLFKKYQVADLTKAYNAAKTPEEKEKLGLQIWATTNPQLAQKLKPGQLGYSEANTAFQAISPLGQFKQATGDMEFANKIPEMQANMTAFNLETPLTGIKLPPTNQIGFGESYSSASPIPGLMEAFTNPLQFFAPQDIGQTKRALIKRAFEERLK